MSSKTVRYVGTTREDAERQFHEDSAKAHWAGWQVKAMGWGQNPTQPTLIVKYSADEPPSPPPPHRPEPQPPVGGTPSPSVTQAPPSVVEPPEEPEEHVTGYRAQFVLIGLGAAIAIAVGVVFSGSGDGPTSQFAAPSTQAPGRFEQTWAKEYDRTTCDDYAGHMDAHERWVMAADFLYTARALSGAPDAPLPPDEQVNAFRDLMKTACGDADARPGVLMTDIATSLVIGADDLRP